MSRYVETIVDKYDLSLAPGSEKRREQWYDSVLTLVGNISEADNK